MITAQPPRTNIDEEALEEKTPPAARADARVRRPGNKRVGLVLEGGGAKGSFQFGCLKALHEQRIIFDAVAGTSVGALNAALWSTTQIEWGEDFWKNISLEKIYPVRRPAYFFGVIAAIYAFLKVTEDKLDRYALLKYLSGIVTAWYLLSSIFAVILLFLYLTVALITLSADLLQNWTALGWVFIPLVPVALIILIEKTGISAFTAEPLRTKLTQRLSCRRFSVPVFATVARRASIFDPDNLSYGSTGIPASAAISLPASVSEYIPDYVRIDKQNFDAACHALLASAALPYGVVPAINNAVDGGIADNIPIFPLVSLLACDVVLVLRANPGHKTQTELLSNWKRIDRLRRISQYNAQSAHKANPKAIPTYRGELIDYSSRRSPAEPYRVPANSVEFFVVAPDWPSLVWWKDLLYRTMNFRPSFTRPQLRYGYIMMQEQLNSGLLAELKRSD